MRVGVRRCDHTRLQGPVRPQANALASRGAYPDPHLQPAAALPGGRRLLAEGSHFPPTTAGRIPHSRRDPRSRSAQRRWRNRMQPQGPELSCEVRKSRVTRGVTETFPSLHSHRSNAREPTRGYCTRPPFRPTPFLPPPLHGPSFLQPASNQMQVPAGPSAMEEDATCHCPPPRYCVLVRRDDQPCCTRRMQHGDEARSLLCLVARSCDAGWISRCRRRAPLTACPIPSCGKIGHTDAPPVAHLLSLPPSGSVSSGGGMRGQPHRGLENYAT